MHGAYWGFVGLYCGLAGGHVWARASDPELLVASVGESVVRPGSEDPGRDVADVREEIAREIDAGKYTPLFAGREGTYWTSIMSDAFIAFMSLPPDERHRVLIAWDAVGPPRDWGRDAPLLGPFEVDVAERWIREHRDLVRGCAGLGAAVPGPLELNLIAMVDGQDPSVVIVGPSPRRPSRFRNVPKALEVELGREVGANGLASCLPDALRPLRFESHLFPHSGGTREFSLELE